MKLPTYSFLFFTFVLISSTIIITTYVYRHLTAAQRNKSNVSTEISAESLKGLPKSLIQEDLLDKLKNKPGDENLVREIFRLQKVQMDKGQNPNDLEEKLGKSHPDKKTVLNKVKKISTIPEQTIETWFKFELYGEKSALKYMRNTGWFHKNPLQMGIIFYESGELNHALKYFKKALSLQKDSKRIKTYIFYTMLDKDDPGLENLIKDPAYAPILNHQSLTEYYLKKKEYGKMIPHLYKSLIGGYTLSAVAASFLSGLGWFFFVLQLGFAGNWSLFYKVLSVFAVALGVFSAQFTLVFLTIQENFFHFEDYGSSLLKMYAYFIAGVGLREELIKLLFFLPIALLIRKEKNELKVLALASLVGLGFAIEENINYYIAGAGTSVIGRFLTANFFHITLTGYCGFYLVRALQKGGEHWSDFVIQTLIMVMIHGSYDFLLNVGNSGGFLATLAFIIITRQYLNIFLESNMYSGVTGGSVVIRRISLPFIFVCSLAITVGMTYFLISEYVASFSSAILLLFSSMIGVGFIAYVFFYEMRDFVAHR